VTAPLPDELSRPPVAGSGEAPWHRLHPLSPLVRAGRQLMSLVVLLAGIGFVNHRRFGGDVVTDLVILGIALTGGFVSWLVTRWQIADGVLRVDTGLIRRESRRFPLSQIQAVDVVQTGLARVLGLAELHLRVAGGDAARSGKLACLRLSDAEQVRRDLLALSAVGRVRDVVVHDSSAGVGSAGVGSVGVATAGLASASLASASVETVADSTVGEGTIPGGTVPGGTVPGGTVPGGTVPGGTVPGGTGAGVLAADRGRLLFRVKPTRLPVAILLSRTGAGAAVVAAAAIVTVVVSGKTGTIAPFLPFVLGVMLNLWRKLNGEYDTTVVAASDGIRLRSGLIQTTAETIRPGRIQAVRLAEPLIWRLFGWCRLEVDVAGARQRREDQAEGQRLRAVIPVGSRTEADQMLAELVGSDPLQPSVAPPLAARWKAPLTYHFLGWNGDEQYVVASRGRVCRQTTWVPLEKVQSIRWVQGPLQRRLGLATVHLDVAGKRVSAKIQDRGNAEALDILATLPDLARAARARTA
jgi:putative membrane protein